jgi:hypothetical protein
MPAGMTVLLATADIGFSLLSDILESSTIIPKKIEVSSIEHAST